MDKIKRGIVEIVFYVFIIGLVLSLAIFGGFALKGFQESFFSGLINISDYLGSYLLYYALIIVALILIIYPIMNMFFIRKDEHPATQDNPGFLRIFTVSYIYNPEDSFLWFIASKFKELKSTRWMTNIVRVIFIGIIFFGLLGLLQLFFPSMNISGVPQTAQQISTASDIFFGAGIPSVAENGTLLFLYFFILGILAFICAKFVPRELRLPVFFLIAMLFIAPLMGIIWMKYHTIVYGNDEASQIATFIFGTLGAELVIITGICFFWLIWHFINNTILILKGAITIKEDIAFFSIIFLIVIIILYALFEFSVRRRKSSPEQEFTQ